MKEFKIHFEEEAFDDLHNRICRTRLPRLVANSNWELGTDESYLIELLDYWREGYDWSPKEHELNQYPQYITRVGELDIHFFHIPGTRKGSIPLLLTHGWPDSFLRYAKTFPLLSEYDLVVPSLPGFAFSTLPSKGFSNNSETADIWHTLMTDVLGYEEYAASGGDMGRGVTCYLASRYPNEVRGIHLTDIGFASSLINAPDDTLTPAELDYKRQAAEWLRTEGAYISENSTKPQTLGFSLSDSPAGMAAWIVEKYHAWSDWPLLTMDDLLDCLTLYWMTNTAATSIRMYHGNSFTLPAMDKVTVPTAFAAFPHDVLPVPKEYIEKTYPIIQYTEMKRGGHFTALEQPEPFVDTVIEFMSSIS